MRFKGVYIPKTQKDISPIRADSTDTSYDVSVGGQYRSESLSFNTSIVDEHQLVALYRQMEHDPEIESALDSIIGDFIVYDNEKPPISINLDGTKLTKPVKKAIEKEFKEISNMMRLNTKADEYAKRFYVDGRFKMHIAIDSEKPDEGVLEIQYIDPRKLHKVREVEQYHIDGEAFVRTKAEYYLYSADGFGYMGGSNHSSSVNGYKIAPDSIVEVNSGKSDPNNTTILSQLHAAIKPLNQLNGIEDSTIIYRMSRAPERRVFYVDVGNLPPAKAEEYLRDMMSKHKNRTVYDSKTGTVNDERRHSAITEDFWMARRDGGKGTEIDTLPGGQNLRDIDNIQYFKAKLYRALKIPASRLEQGSRANYANVSDVQRDERKFSNYITRQRVRFADIFNQILRVQLTLKNIMLPEDFDDIIDGINYNFIQDNYFTELTQDALLEKRLRLFKDAGFEVTDAYSLDWARKNILRQTDSEITEEDVKIDEETPEGGAEEPSGGGGRGRY